jgi:hypothetical protein
MPSVKHCSSRKNKFSFVFLRLTRWTNALSLWADFKEQRQVSLSHFSRRSERVYQIGVLTGHWRSFTIDSGDNRHINNNHCSQRRSYKLAATPTYVMSDARQRRLQRLRSKYSWAKNEPKNSCLSEFLCLYISNYCMIAFFTRSSGNKISYDDHVSLLLTYFKGYIS